MTKSKIETTLIDDFLHGRTEKFDEEGLKVLAAARAAAKEVTIDPREAEIKRVKTTNMDEIADILYPDLDKVDLDNEEVFDEIRRNIFNWSPDTTLSHEDRHGLGLVQTVVYTKVMQHQLDRELIGSVLEESQKYEAYLRKTLGLVDPAAHEKRELLAKKLSAVQSIRDVLTSNPTVKEKMAGARAEVLNLLQTLTQEIDTSDISFLTMMIKFLPQTKTMDDIVYKYTPYLDKVNLDDIKEYKKIEELAYKWKPEQELSSDEERGLALMQGMLCSKLEQHKLDSMLQACETYEKHLEKKLRLPDPYEKGQYYDEIDTEVKERDSLLAQKLSAVQSIREALSSPQKSATEKLKNAKETFKTHQNTLSQDVDSPGIRFLTLIFKFLNPGASAVAYWKAMKAEDKLNELSDGKSSGPT